MWTDVSQNYQGDHFTIYSNIESLSCTPEINIMLYGNYIPVKRKHDGYHQGSQIKSMKRNCHLGRQIKQKFQPTEEFNS